MQTSLSRVIGSFLFLTVFCASPAQAQPEKVIDSIKKAGGYIETDPKDPTAAIVFIMGANVSDKELESLAELKTLRKVTLRATASKVTDRGIAALAMLPDLEEAYLSNSQMTDAGLGKLAGLKKLKKLSLISTKISDRGVGMLKDFPAIEWVDIGNVKVSTAGLAQLAGCKNLKALFISDQPSLTDAVLEKLAGAPMLERLELVRTLKITDKGLAPLKKLPLQRLLILAADGVTDASIKTLADYPQLTDLELWSCKNVTDKSLPDFENLKKLEKLRLTGSGVTIAGTRKLKKSMPGVMITP